MPRPSPKQLLKYVFVILLLLLALPVVFVLASRYSPDEMLSPEAQRILAAHPEPTKADYIWLGLWAVKEDDPVIAGAAFYAEMEDSRKNQRFVSWMHLHSGGDSIVPDMGSANYASPDLCDPASTGCIALLKDDRKVATQHLRAQAYLLERENQYCQTLDAASTQPDFMVDAYSAHRTRLLDQLRAMDILESLWKSETTKATNKIGFIMDCRAQALARPGGLMDSRMARLRELEYWIRWIPVLKESFPSLKIESFPTISLTSLKETREAEIRLMYPAVSCLSRSASSFCHSDSITPEEFVDQLLQTSLAKPNRELNRSIRDLQTANRIDLIPDAQLARIFSGIRKRCSKPHTVEWDNLLLSDVPTCPWQMDGLTSYARQPQLWMDLLKEKLENETTQKTSTSHLNRFGEPVSDTANHILTSIPTPNGNGIEIKF